MSVNNEDYFTIYFTQEFADKTIEPIPIEATPCIDLINSMKITQKEKDSMLDEVTPKIPTLCPNVPSFFV